MSTGIILGAVPPPPGVEANFVDPPNQTRETIVLHTICLTGATFCVAVRIYTRKFIAHQLSWDDYCCVLSWALSIVFSALMIESDVRGLGRHLWDIPADQHPKLLKVTMLLAVSAFPLMSSVRKIYTLAQCASVLVPPAVKMSCLLFYQRVLFPTRRVVWLVHAGVVFLLAAYTALFFATIFQCDPFEKAWNTTVPGRCLPRKPLPYAVGIVNVVSGIYVLVWPFACKWGLHLNMGAKLGALAVFILGMFASAASVTRLALTPRIFSSVDTTWNLSQIGFWAVIEYDVGIMCACSFALPVFMKRHGLSDLGSYVRRLSRSSSRQEEKSSGTSIVVESIQFPKSSEGDRSDDLKLNAHGHSELHENGNATKMQYIMSRETTDDQDMPASRATESDEDVEAWPGYTSSQGRIAPQSLE